MIRLISYLPPIRRLRLYTHHLLLMTRPLLPCRLPFTVPIPFTPPYSLSTCLEAAHDHGYTHVAIHNSNCYASNGFGYESVRRLHNFTH